MIFAANWGKVYAQSYCLVRCALALAFFMLYLRNSEWGLTPQHGMAFSSVMKMKTQMLFKMAAL